MSAPDLARLARACHLHAQPTGARLWSVSGGAGVHIVDPTAGTCDCADYAMRRGVCKHLARVRLALGDAETLAELCELVPMPKRPRRKRSDPLSTVGARGGLTP